MPELKDRRPAKPPDAADTDELKGQMLAVLVRLEAETAAHRKMIESTTAEVRSLQHVVSEFAALADEIRQLRHLKAVAKIFAVVIVLGIVSFVREGVVMRERLDVAREEIASLRSKQELVERAVNNVDANVRSLATEVREWRSARAEADERLEKTLDSLNRRRR